MKGNISKEKGGGTVTSEKLADGAVTTSKVADKAVTGAKIADSTITSTKLASNSVTSAKISGSIAVAKGGTGKTSWVANGLPYPSSSTAFTQLAFPTEESVLCQKATGAPYWTALSEIGGGSVSTPTVYITGINAFSAVRYGVKASTDSGETWFDLTGTYPQPGSNGVVHSYKTSAANNDSGASLVCCIRTPKIRFKIGNALSAYSADGEYFEVITDGGVPVSVTIPTEGWSETQDFEVDEICVVRFLTRIACLSRDTLITMADGSLRRIDALSAGDRVLSYNPETGETEADSVVLCDAKEGKTHTEYDVWTLSDGTEITTVHRHRFYNAEKKAFVYMDEWAFGDHFIKEDGTSPSLVGHENIKGGIGHCTLFTKNQNYFANGCLSGNRYTKKLLLGGEAL